jgi:Domain of unknown function (DUF1871)
MVRGWLLSMDHKQRRQDAKLRYKELLALVGKVIADWDPYGLLAGGAPDDEFSSEIASVAAQVPRIKSSTDAAHAVSRVFSSSFDPEEFELTSCYGVGHHLFAALVADGFIVQRQGTLADFLMASPLRESGLDLSQERISGGLRDRKIE